MHKRGEWKELGCQSPLLDFSCIIAISAALILILCFSMQTILLQAHHRSLVFTATSSCCLSSNQRNQCHSPSRRRSPAVMTPLTSTLSSQHCWPLQYHLSYTHTDQHNCQQLVVESAEERLHQGIKTQGPNISSHYSFCVLGTFMLLKDLWTHNRLLYFLTYSRKLGDFELGIASFVWVGIILYLGWVYVSILGFNKCICKTSEAAIISDLIYYLMPRDTLARHHLTIFKLRFWFMAVFRPDTCH